MLDRWWPGRGGRRGIDEILWPCRCKRCPNLYRKTYQKKYQQRRCPMVVAVYPGTFDPLTRGHEDLVRRASSIFDTLVVGVADSRHKKPFFSLAERLDIAHDVLGHYP